MAVNLAYTDLLTEIAPYKAEGRTESAAFLIWYLVNYYRLDELEATDAVCDQFGDKGVDGIYVNEGEASIDIFQAKISQKERSSVGDTQLKEFHGTLAQFESVENLERLIATGGDAQVVRLVKKLGLVEKLATYKVRGVFVANLDSDNNGNAYLDTVPIVFHGRTELEQTYVSDKKDSIQQGAAAFDVFGLSVTDYVVDADTKATIAPVLASDLVSLAGILDQSLFSSNVRASLGNTNVNKGIAKSIRDKGLHKAFPLFHNGITILARSVNHDERHIKIEDYYVVNGCQSLNTLWAHRGHISGDLRILTKFIQVRVDSDLAHLITTYSNNQNGVKARDFKSNDPVQTRLQNEFKQNYGNLYAYAVKRGEPIEGAVEISNEEAGLLLIAFDLEEPWTTHRKYQIFDERYTQVFARPDVTADRIVMLWELCEQLKAQLSSLRNEQVGKYALTKYVAMYAMKKIFEEDATGKDIIANPQTYVRAEAAREAFRKMLKSVIRTMMVDLDYETKDLGADFDYRDKLRDKTYVTNLIGNLVSSHKKDVIREKIPTVADAWASAN